MMKLLYTALLCCAVYFNVHSQCTAIEVNYAEVIPTDSSAGSCTYQIQASITLNHGNASVKIFYTCGLLGQEMLLSDCFAWNKPSTQNFTSSVFSCPCMDQVYVRLVGQSNPSCGGNVCGEVSSFNGGNASSGQLALDLTNFRVLGAFRGQLCFAWSIVSGDSGTDFFLERSKDGIVFYPFSSFKAGDKKLRDNLGSICLDYYGYDPYFRLKSVTSSGDIIFSPIRHYRPPSARASIHYVWTAGQIWLTGDEQVLAGSLLSLYNSYGQLVFQDRVKSNQINLQGCSPGIYFVQVVFSGTSIVKKIRI